MARSVGEAAATAAASVDAAIVGVWVPDMATAQAGVTTGVTVGAWVDRRFKGGVKAAPGAAHADTTADSDASADVEDGTLREVLLLGAPSGEAAAAVTDRSTAIGRGVVLARQLVEGPPNAVTPAVLTGVAATVAAMGDGWRLVVLDADDAAAVGMGAFGAVAAGGGAPSRFIHLAWTPPGGAQGGRAVALVGKGVTFDTGGYNLKLGAASMLDKMKFDMGGAAAVLGAARALAEIRPPVEVHLVIAACENLISGTAMRPGDIVTASNGRTIEVANTDAEGRLTLADALAYATNLSGVDRVVELSTLTGAVIAALGKSIGALLTPNDALAESLQASASAAGEPLWRLPLYAPYTASLDSSLADISNLGAKGGVGAGAITAGLFLGHFVKPGVAWAHIDIAGTAWDHGGDAGATGYGVATLVHWVMTHGATEENGVAKSA
eukprot:contig_16369_g3976